MGKRLAAVLIFAALTFSLGGCWNYRSLDQLDLVVGVALDFEEEANKFSISYEAADLSGAKDEAVKGKLIQAQGTTLFDTVRNAKKREEDKLFFGSSQVLIISRQLIEGKEIVPLIEWFLRDGECRESMCVAISQEETASVILESPEKMAGMMSVVLHDIIQEDSDVTSSSIHTKLYQIYSQIKSQSKCVMLPALHRIKSGDETISAINGIAVVKEDGLAGFLTPDQSKYVTMAAGEMGGGIITLSMSNEGKDDVSLEVFENKVKKDFTYEQGKLTFRIHTRTKVTVGENQNMLDMTDKEQLRKITEAAQSKIEENIDGVLKVVQEEFNADIFGFGEMIYRKDPSLWKELEPKWDQVYPTVAVEVKSEIGIMNFGAVK